MLFKKIPMLHIEIFFLCVRGDVAVSVLRSTATCLYTHYRVCTILNNTSIALSSMRLDKIGHLLIAK